MVMADALPPAKLTKRSTLSRLKLNSIVWWRRAFVKKRVLPQINDDEASVVVRQHSSRNKLSHNSGGSTRYIQPDDIWEALATGHVRLVKMSWLIKRHAANQNKKRGSAGIGKLPRRQEMPEEAFISVEELKGMYGSGNSDGVLPIVAVSYCWLTPNHPDPECDQLRTVANALARDREAFEEFGYSEMGVFWDWLSLHQRDDSLWKPYMYRPDERLNQKQRLAKQRYYNSRNEAETESIRYALTETMDLWYAHMGTTVYLLVELPWRYAGRRPDYDASGWTTYERCSAELVKDAFLDHAEWKLVQALTDNTPGRPTASAAHRRAVAKRRWPIGPDDFDKLVQSKTFTNGADQQAVSELYRRLATNLLGGSISLDYEGLPTPSAEDGARLGRCLNLCTNVVTVDLQSDRIDGECCAAIFGALDKGVMPSLEHLYLQDNDIDDEGMHAIANAINRGSMHKLKRLSTLTASETRPDGEFSGYSVLTAGINLSSNPGDSAIVNRVLAM